MAGGECGELQGIPCHVEDRGGTLVVGLSFRVGWSDEELTSRGITHLVEHLALYAASRTRLTMNGSVAPTTTTFAVRGQGDDVVEFFRLLCRSLRDLPRERVETEARVLRTEDQGADGHGSMAAELLRSRFGAGGYGLAAFPELGLVAPDPDEVQAWAARWFTAGNAAVWATGPLPPDLVLDLPAGPRMPPRPPEPLPRPFPGWYQEGHGMVGLSSLVERGDAGDLAAWLLRRRLHDRLRLDQGHSYSVTGAIEKWTAGDAYVSVFADTLEESAEAVRDAFLGELGRLAVEAPAPDELAPLIDDLDREWRLPESAGPIASARAENELAGAAGRDHAERVAALRAIAPRDVARVADRMLHSAVLNLPLGVELRDRRFAVLNDAGEAVIGRPFARAFALGQPSDTHTLFVGQAGVTLVDAAGTPRTVPFTSVAAAQRWTDGAWTLWGRDGVGIVVHPGEWRDGPIAVAMVDGGITAAPPGSVVVMPVARGSALVDEAQRRGPGAVAGVALPRQGLLDRVRRLSRGGSPGGR